MLSGAGEGGVNSRMAPPPAVTGVTLTDYSVSSALITLRSPLWLVPSQLQLQGINTENPQPTPSSLRHGHVEAQNRRVEETLEIGSFPGLGVSVAGNVSHPPWRPLSYHRAGQGPVGLRKFAE